jgi:hypothetical protein
MKNIVIVDIDGVLIEIDEYSKNIPSNPNDWEEYYKSVSDKPVFEMCKLIRIIFPFYRIVFCTGRMENQRQKTVSILEKNVIFGASKALLLMRKKLDLRPDIIVKPELLREAGIDFDDIAFVIEDRSCMVKKYRELGLICLQCADGEF